MAKGISVDLIVDPKKAIEGIGRVESRASGASQTLGRLGRVAGAAFLSVGLAAAVGAVTLGGAVVKSFSEYEQLAGGVTKLFGDADQTVSKFAQNAAVTAGLSTNAYLNTVTSFSASLISGLHGDQEAAARSADQAVTDMADNANTFGTSIDSIQLAYQGFAKGNFTLLDNLKLGFGGSQQGMADLINTSGVLGSSMKVTAQNVKDVPFDKMIEAIHVVQTQMGIAGTTAKEASSTILGSFEATKASIANLITGMGTADADFDTLVGNVVSNAENLVNNVGPVITNLAKALPEIAPVLISAVEKVVPALVPLAADLISSLLSGLVKAAPALIKGAIPIILNLVTGIVSQLPAILDAGIKVLVSLVQGITAALPTLIPAAVEATIGLVTALVDNLPLLIDAGIQLLLGVTLGLVNAIPQLIDALPTIITALIEGLVGAIPQLVMAGVQLLLAIVQNMPAIVGGIIKAVPVIIDALIKTLGDPKFWQAMGDAGLQLIRGLWEGIKGAGAWLWNQIKGFFNGVINNIKNLFGIHSPSTVFSGFGDNMIAGLVGGIKGGYGLVKNTMGDLSDKVSDGFQSSLAVNARATLSTTGGAALGGGGDVNINVNVNGVAGPETGRQIVNAIQQYVRSGGTGLRAVMG